MSKNTETPEISPENIPAPNKFPWPPVILISCLLGAVMLNKVIPVPWPASLDNSLVAVLGVIVLVAGIGLEIWTISYFGKMKTNLSPIRPADKLLTEGPFNLSRNPIYLGNFLLILSFTALFANLWFSVFALILIIATGKLAIAREERHLDAKFGQDYRDYATNVRRWM